MNGLAKGAQGDRLMHSYKHILLAAELNTETRLLAERAQLLASACKAQISIMHALPTLGVTLSGEMSVPAAGVGKMHQDAQRQIADLAAELGIPEQRCHLISEISKAAITRLAGQIDADLLVLGYHEKGFFGNIFGATAQKILHSVKCDVLVVHMPEESTG